MKYKIRSIAEGTINNIKAELGVARPEIEAMAATRLAFCDSCEYLNAAIRKCRLCGCPVDRKTRSPYESCPIPQHYPNQLGKWHAHS